MNKLKGLLSAAACFAWTSAAYAERQYNLTPPVTQVADRVDTLHWVLLWLCIAIGVGVFAVMFYSIYAHRRSKGYTPATFSESHTVEVIWTIIPFLIVVGIGAYATPMVVAQKDTSNADLTIKATGYQWKWGYDYLKGEGEGISFLSTLTTPQSQIDDRAFPDAITKRSTNENYLREVDNEVVVPVGKKVRIVLTANDVIHAWMIPAFGVKQDAIPGFVRDTWFKAEKVGTYRGQCAELCGKDHAFMPIVVRVVNADEYTKWVDGKKKEMAAAADDPNKVFTLEELKQRGEKVYAANCAACHQATGKGVPGAFPALDGSKVVTGPQADQITMLLKGKGAMPKWDQLSDTELAAVMTYTRNAWGNTTGQLIQPSVFKDARAGKLPAAQAAAGEPVKAAEEKVNKSEKVAGKSERRADAQPAG